MNDKITGAHSDRPAYIRQSTLQQVQHNVESNRWQHALRERAKALGFSAVAAVDEDLHESKVHFFRIIQYFSDEADFLRMGNECISESCKRLEIVSRRSGKRQSVALHGGRRFGRCARRSQP